MQRYFDFSTHLRYSEIMPPTDDSDSPSRSFLEAERVRLRKDFRAIDQFMYEMKHANHLSRQKLKEFLPQFADRIDALDSGRAPGR